MVALLIGACKDDGVVKGSGLLERHVHPQRVAQVGDEQLDLLLFDQGDVAVG
jgi:hypothetical protein